MTNELKPCPFCGGEAELFESEESDDVYDPDTLGFLDTYYVTVHCVICRSCGIEGIYNSQDKAIEAWNTRAERTCNVKPLPLSGFTEFTCSKCDGTIRQLSNYCPHCGAKVVSE